MLLDIVCEYVLRIITVLNVTDVVTNPDQGNIRKITHLFVLSSS